MITQAILSRLTNFLVSNRTTMWFLWKFLDVFTEPYVVIISCITASAFVFRPHSWRQFWWFIHRPVTLSVLFLVLRCHIFKHFAIKTTGREAMLRQIWINGDIKQFKKKLGLSAWNKRDYAINQKSNFSKKFAQRV